MVDWAAKLDDFLRLNEYEVLSNAGHVSADSARKKAEAEYEKFRVVQDASFQSDFDRMVSDVKAAGGLARAKRAKKGN